MANEEPFVLSKRKNSPYWQVRFKNPDTTSSVRYLSAISTKETSHSRAVAKAWSMFNEKEVKNKSIVQSIRSDELSDDDVETLIKLLKENGKIVSVTLPQQKSSVTLLQFLLDFWTVDKSPFIAEKKRLGRHIGLHYISDSYSKVKYYWCPYFSEDKLLCETTRKDLKDFIAAIDKLPVSWSSKLKAYRAGSIALKWAFNDELLDRDITVGITSFSGKSKQRQILTMELAELLFTTEWDDERSKIVNLIAMLTGMRCGEILALRKMDLGENCLYINHSWNQMEGLKTTKTGETRVVYFPFPQIINNLLSIVENKSLESLIFNAPIKDNQPMDIKLPLKYLRRQLMKIGLSEAESKKYCFHSWRHFYTTYMYDKVNQRALQSQTGHKTIEMLEHYGNHQINSDIQAIEEAQKAVFGKIVKLSGY